MKNILAESSVRCRSEYNVIVNEKNLFRFGKRGERNLY
jgi:hypothetical protein